MTATLRLFNLSSLPKVLFIYSKADTRLLVFIKKFKNAFKPENATTIPQDVYNAIKSKRDSLFFHFQHQQTEKSF